MGGLPGSTVLAADAMTVDSTTWGFKRNSDLSDYLSPLDIISTLIETVAFGGNLLCKGRQETALLVGLASLLSLASERWAHLGRPHRARLPRAPAAIGQFFEGKNRC